jgi:hypothetical protein
MRILSAATKKIIAERKASAVAELEAMGAERLKQEDSLGYTKSGWWLDRTFLGPLSDPEHCLRVVRGN